MIITRCSSTRCNINSNSYQHDVNGFLLLIRWDFCEDVVFRFSGWTNDGVLLSVQAYYKFLSSFCQWTRQTSFSTILYISHVIRFQNVCKKLLLPVNIPFKLLCFRSAQNINLRRSVFGTSNILYYFYFVLFLLIISVSTSAFLENDENSIFLFIATTVFYKSPLHIPQ